MGYLLVLDWTDTFAVALYFALEGWTEHNEPSIWVVNPYQVNEITWEDAI